MNVVGAGPEVFISYRHHDAREIVDRMFDYLDKDLGANHTFRDVEGIGSGDLIRERVDSALKACKIMLVVIGKEWTEKGDLEQKRRLYDPEDYVFHEITTALRANLPIIVVTVHNADLPDKTLLPAEIRPAFGRLAFQVRGNPNFAGDMQSLAQAVKDSLLDASTPRPATANAPVAVSLFGHSNFFFWWPVWALAFAFGALTWWSNERLAIVPADTTIQHDAAAKQIVLTIPDASATGTLKTALEQKAKAEDGFPQRIADNKNYGVLFTTGLLLIILITNIRMRGPWSLIIVVSIVVLTVLLAYMGAWDNIFTSLALFRVSISSSGYFYLAGVLFPAWLVVVFFFDRQAYVVFTPREVRVRSELGGPELTFSVFNLTITRRREDEFRHWILGYGSSDLTIQTAGENGQEFIFFNVLSVGTKLHALREMYKDSPVKITA